ncbi:MAG: hypothetical protein INR69_16120 [Mucilaginibacter polytrichastri]|nr:hypothetical protein [Mucilaginibacter polytrichastri]
MNFAAARVVRLFRVFSPEKFLDTLDDERKSRLRHENIRRLRNNAEVLGDIPHQLFLRLTGLFNTTPSVTPDDSRYEAAVKFAQLRDFIEAELQSPDGDIFARYELGDYVHNLHLLLIDVLPLSFLEANISTMYDDFRGRVGEHAFHNFISSDFHKKMNDLSVRYLKDQENERVAKDYERHFRHEYRTVVNEIRKSRLFEEHIEDTRVYLIRSVRNMFLQSILLPVTILSFYLYADYKHILSEYVSGFSILALGSLSAIFGAAGSFLSTILRIQGVRDNNQVAQNIVAFKFSEKAVRLAPLTGMMFALVLSLLFGSGLVGGSLFPKYVNNFLLNAVPGEMAKWMIWSFIAGFSERLVPDMVDRISDKAKKAEEK